MDPMAVYIATQEALKLMRSGQGPVIIEADVYRFFHQNGPYPGSAFGYSTIQEELEWKARYPLELVASSMIERGLLHEEDVTQLRIRSIEAVSTASARLLVRGDLSPINP